LRHRENDLKDMNRMSGVAVGGGPASKQQKSEVGNSLLWKSLIYEERG